MGGLAGAAGGASGAGLGLTALSSIVSASGTQASDQFQAEVLNQKAQVGQAAATEVNANYVQKLNMTLGNIDAVRAAGHNNPAGPEASVLRGTTEEYANESKSIAVGNILQQSQMDTASANYLNQAGSFAMLQGVLGAGGGAATTAGKTDFGSFGLPPTMTNNPTVAGSLY
jgi:hypothetical protein